MSNSFHLAVMPGDGIGIEVMDAALAVLDAAEKRFGLATKREPIKGGALHFRDTGATLEPGGLERSGKADAILFGAMGWPDIRYPDGTEIAPQVDMRFHFGLFAGVRPIRAIPGVPTALADPRARNIDFVLIRESTEGLFKLRREGVVIEDRDTQVSTRDITEKLTHASFAIARQRQKQGRGKGEVRLVDKANIFRSFAFMRKVFYEVAAQYPDIKAAHHYVDAMALDLVRRPWDFDVLPTENMFGDILSDLAAGLVGGMGFSPSADLSQTHGLFQPSHGTAPDIAGKRIANPTAMILSAAMMLDWLATTRDSDAAANAARAIEKAVDLSFGTGMVKSYDIGGTSGTDDVGRAVIAMIESGKADPA
jgi:3-isopropylmalate dehydrogenase